MTKAELIKEVSDFRYNVELFRQLLLDSRDDMFPDIVRNHAEIATQRSSLVRTRARLERYLGKLGKNPRMRDGLNPEYYHVYDNAFSTDILLRVGPSIESVLQDLDHVLGTLDAMSEEELKKIFEQQKEVADTPSIIANTGGGGGGGGGPGGGRGGDGGSVHIIQGILPEKITIYDVKNPHKEYFKMLFGSIWGWTIKHVKEVIIGVVVTVAAAIVLAWLGLK
ncbi:MAG: hypothetical protein WCT40_04170 [Candidatus Magasanikbacteria bacterium]|jgi:hypothetical protein